MTDATGGRVVAVLGYSGRRRTRLHPICAERLAYAERLAVVPPPAEPTVPHDQPAPSSVTP